MPDVFCRSFNGIGISFAFYRRSAPRRVIVVFPHTFGRHLNFNCYLHMLVSEGGWRERVPRELFTLFSTQYERLWIIDVKWLQSKAHILRYAGRYAKRPPIAQHRLRQAPRRRGSRTRDLQAFI